MASKGIVLFLYLFLLVVPSGVLAQYVPGKKSGNGVALEYKKAVGDSLQVRKSKLEPKKKKSGAAKPRNTATERVKVVSPKVDSVKYEPRTYRLGERVVMQGDSGRDVRNVADILVKKLYFDEDSIIYTKGGGVLYDGDLVRAVKHFQEFNGFYPDGIIGQELIKAFISSWPIIPSG